MARESLPRSIPVRVDKPSVPQHGHGPADVRPRAEPHVPFESPLAQFAPAGRIPYQFPDPFPAGLVCAGAHLRFRRPAAFQRNMIIPAPIRSSIRVGVPVRSVVPDHLDRVAARVVEDGDRDVPHRRRLHRELRARRRAAGTPRGCRPCRTSPPGCRPRRSASGIQGTSQSF